MMFKLFFTRLFLRPLLGAFSTRAAFSSRAVYSDFVFFKLVSSTSLCVMFRLLGFTPYMLVPTSRWFSLEIKESLSLWIPETCDLEVCPPCVLIIFWSKSDFIGFIANWFSCFFSEIFSIFTSSFCSTNYIIIGSLAGCAFEKGSLEGCAFEKFSSLL